MGELNARRKMFDDDGDLPTMLVDKGLKFLSEIVGSAGFKEECQDQQG